MNKDENDLDVNPNTAFKVLDTMQPFSLPMNEFNSELPSPANVAQLILNKSVDLNSLIGQMFCTSDNLIFNETWVSGQVMYLFHFCNIIPIHQKMNISPFGYLRDKFFNILNQFFLNCRFGVKITVQIQGFKQCQGALALVYYPGTEWSFKRAVGRKDFAFGVDPMIPTMYMRWPRVIIPTMESTNFTFVMPWISPIPSVFTSVDENVLKDGKFPANNFPTKVDNGLFFIVPVVPMQAVKGVENYPVIKVYQSIVDLEYGVYQPRPAPGSLKYTTVN